MPSKWFKNLQIYRISHAFELDVTTLGKQLEEYAFTPCGSQEKTRSH
ncbi:MAG: recombination-associated protein RdgC [Gammaproteobacteria bacterium]|nr:recombination-associated protein RdgC [Gammaproteobacteria bacterium]